MESQRFEELARGLALARSRRDVVKALFGTLLAGGAVVAQRGGALAQDCTTDADCADGLACVEGVCTPPPCETDADCTGEGEICCAEACRVLECCIDDEDPNARCGDDETCFEGQCVPIDGPPACETDEECAEGEICCAGGCLAIECCIDNPDPNAHCPEGTSCFEGMCDPVPEPGACASDDDCGEDHICCAGFCREIECCIDEEDPNARCSEGTSCFEGVCDPIDDGGKKDDGTSGTSEPVVALPSTGSGSASGGGTGMMSAILAAGAAAAAGLGLRARRVRPAESDVQDR
jgi:hypothetical protein